MQDRKIISSLSRGTKQDVCYEPNMEESTKYRNLTFLKLFVRLNKFIAKTSVCTFSSNELPV